MEITFYLNNDEPNKVNKTLSSGYEIEGSLKSECTIENPIILIESDIDINQYNYFYIPEFDRYYFRTRFTVVRNGLIRIEGKTDVLMSFKDQIQNFDVKLDHSEVFNTTNYASSPVWKTLVKTKTDILNFPYGLSDDGEFILITAGG